MRLERALWLKLGLNKFIFLGKTTAHLNGARLTIHIFPREAVMVSLQPKNAGQNKQDIDDSAIFVNNRVSNEQISRLHFYKIFFDVMITMLDGEMSYFKNNCIWFG